MIKQVVIIVCIILKAPLSGLAQWANKRRGRLTGVTKHATPTPPRGGPGVQMDDGASALCRAR